MLSSVKKKSSRQKH